MDVGFVTLILSFAFSTLSATFFTYSYFKKNEKTAKFAEDFLYASLSLCVASLLVLAYYFLTDNFSILYVYENSDKFLPMLYKLSAVWAGRSGSLLLWSLFSLLVASIVVSKSEKNLNALKTSVILTAISSYILFINCATSNPFIVLPFKPSDGVGLNPLLRTPEMVLHPPVVFLGYALTAVPYAFYLADVKRADKWAKAAWTVLTLGIVLGGWWAYRTLGWGGFWGWDPVENASLLPWMALAAYFHSSGKIREFFAYIAFTLVIFAAFLTRSGIIKSVHAFGVGYAGWFYFAFMLASLVALIKLRSRDGKKRTWYYYVPYLFTAGIIAIFLGTITNIAFSVNKTYYLITFVPIFAIMAGLIAYNLKKFKSYKLLLHIGVLLLFVGAMGVWFFEQSYEFTLNPSANVAGMNFTLINVNFKETPERYVIISKIKVDNIGYVKPKMYIYKIERSDRMVSSVEIVPRLLYDYYFAIKGFTNGFHAVILDFYIVPLISLVWIGSAIMILAGAIAAFRSYGTH